MAQAVKIFDQRGTPFIFEFDRILYFLAAWAEEVLCEFTLLRIHDTSRAARQTTKSEE
jgi:hypothetical protein